MGKMEKYIPKSFPVYFNAIPMGQQLLAPCSVQNKQSY